MSEKILKKIVEKLESHDDEFKKIDQRFEKIDQRFEKNDGHFDKLLNTVIDLQHTINEKMATKDDLHELEDRVVTHIDGFVKLHETLDVEVVSLRNKYDRLAANP